MSQATQELKRYTLPDMKPLTLDQYDRAKQAALARVKKRIGNKPTRKQFQRELSPLWTILDVLALVVFIPALIISSIHILNHMGGMADNALREALGETIVSPEIFRLAHQWLMIPLAEGSLILFLVMFGLVRDGWRRWVYVALAGLALVFILVANINSGLAGFESLLAPAFTIGIGLKLEHLIGQSLKRRKEVDEKYFKALEVYEAASQDATKHPDYQAVLMQEVWAALTKLKANQVYADAPTPFKHGAVRREMQRDQWAYAGEVQAVEEFVGEGVAPNAPAIPFGNTPPGAGDGAYMAVTESASGHGITASANGHNG